MVSFGFGQVAEATKNTGFNIFLLFYYNQVLQVSATGTSIALAVALGLLGGAIPAISAVRMSKLTGSQFLSQYIVVTDIYIRTGNEFRNFVLPLNPSLNPEQNLP